MKCQEVMELMQRHLDDDLDSDEIEVLYNHTRQCPDCAAMFERLKLLSQELTSLPKVVPSYSLVDAILPELERIDRLAGRTAEDSDPTAAAKAAGHGGTVQPDSRMSRRAGRKRWPSWRALGGVIAAGIVTGLFIATYPPGMSKDKANSDMYTADGAVSMNMESDVAQKMKIVPGEAAGGDAPVAGDAAVGTESYVNGGNSGKQAEPEGSQSSGYVPLSSESASGGSAPRQEEAEERSGAESWRLEDQYGEESFVEPTDGPAKAATEQPPGFLETEPDANGFTVNNTALGTPSPDGLYLASADQHSIRVVALDTGETMLETARKNGKHTNIVWAEDSSSLTYEVQLEQGAIERYVIDAVKWREQKAGQH